MTGWNRLPAVSAEVRGDALLDVHHPHDAAHAALPDGDLRYLRPELARLAHHLVVCVVVKRASDVQRHPDPALHAQAHEPSASAGTQKPCVRR